MRKRTGKVVDTRGDGALVGEVAGDASLVAGLGLSDEGRVEDETVLGGVTTGLEGTEESLLSTENLDGGGGVLCEVDQASSVGDQTSSDDVSDETGEVGGDVAHLVVEVVVELLAVLVEVDDLERKAADVEHVEVRDVCSHGALGSLDDLLGLVLIGEELGELSDLLLCDGGLLSLLLETEKEKVVESGK